ncbi:MAG: hypothetical protein SFW66_02350 [Gammaproteobacteria bacterium]|nr:hypothetical protein [Gammaproteobacteria bacterium]
MAIELDDLAKQQLIEFHARMYELVHAVFTDKELESMNEALLLELVALSRGSKTELEKNEALKKIIDTCAEKIIPIIEIALKEILSNDKIFAGVAFDDLFDKGHKIKTVDGHPAGQVIQKNSDYDVFFNPNGTLNLQQWRRSDFDRSCDFNNEDPENPGHSIVTKQSLIANTLSFYILSTDCLGRWVGSSSPKAEDLLDTEDKYIIFNVWGFLHKSISIALTQMDDLSVALKRCVLLDNPRTHEIFDKMLIIEKLAENYMRDNGGSDADVSLLKRSLYELPIEELKKIENTPSHHEVNIDLERKGEKSQYDLLKDILKSNIPEKIAELTELKNQFGEKREEYATKTGMKPDAQKLSLIVLAEKVAEDFLKQGIPISAIDQSAKDIFWEKFILRAREELGIKNPIAILMDKKGFGKVSGAIFKTPSTAEKDFKDILGSTFIAEKYEQEKHHLAQAKGEHSLK